MDCRKFRDKHALFIDERCSELEAFEMRSHMRFCPECDRHDTVVRRGIMLMRNLPRIRPSKEFAARLSARLQAEVRDDQAVGERSPRLARYASFAAAVAAVAAVAVLALGAVRVFEGGQPDILRMAPVVASEPLSAPSPFGTPALVATVPTGMSIWPAILMASQAPAHFVATELANER